jgi:hypothetical protein
MGCEFEREFIWGRLKMSRMTNDLVIVEQERKVMIWSVFICNMYWLKFVKRKMREPMGFIGFPKGNNVF